MYLSDVQTYVSPIPTIQEFFLILHESWPNTRAENETKKDTLRFQGLLKLNLSRAEIPYQSALLLNEYSL